MKPRQRERQADSSQSVTITSIARLVLLVDFLYLYPTAPDQNFSVGFLSSAIEVNLAIITASAPALRPLFRNWFPGSSGSPTAKQGGPSLIDMEALEEYLYKVITLERDMEKARGLVKWLEWCVVDGGDGDENGDETGDGVVGATTVGDGVGSATLAR